MFPFRWSSQGPLVPRVILRWLEYPNLTTPLLQIPTDHLARGAYWVQVISGGNAKTKKLIIH